MSLDNIDYQEKLSNITEKAQGYATTAFDYLDDGIDKASDIVRDQLQKYDWVPEWARPRAPPPPPPPEVLLTMTRAERVQDWLSRNKILVGAVALTTGYVAYKVYRKSMSMGKLRRARRARNGGRLEVVIIAGSPSLPLTRCLALDLERKGFIVFVVCSTIEEEMTVQNLSRPDVRPMSIDITDPARSSTPIERFAQFLQTPHAPVPKATPSYLNLTSVILIPSLNYQTSPIATIPPSAFSDLFNTHLLRPILTIQAFLPLLTAQLNPHSKESPPKVLVFTPSIISSLNPPFHAPESTVCSALAAFTDVLTAELQPLNIPVTHVQLGTFDFSGFSPAMARSHAPATAATGFHPSTANSVPPSLPPPTDAGALPWADGAKAAYGKNYIVTSASAVASGRIEGMRGSSLGDLHNAVFDVLDGSESTTVVRIGLGADIYGFVGRWAPRGLVSWMMGVKPVEHLAIWPRPNNGEDGETDDDEDTDDDDDDDDGAVSGSTFVNVDAEHSGANVWREAS